MKYKNGDLVTAAPRVVNPLMEQPELVTGILEIYTVKKRTDSWKGYRVLIDGDEGWHIDPDTIRSPTARERRKASA